MRDRIKLIQCRDANGDDKWVPIKNILVLRDNVFKEGRYCIWFNGPSGEVESATCSRETVYETMEFIE